MKMKFTSRFVAILLAMVVLMISLVLAALSDPVINVWSGKTEAPSDSNGDGIYEIYKPEELAWAVANFGKGYKYSIENDIYLNDVSAPNWQSNSSNNAWFEANIWNYYSNGSEEGTFAGTVYGNGHSVYGIWYPEDTASNSSGLFPVVSDATITDLGVENSLVLATRFAGGLIGAQYRGNVTISRCFVADDVTVTQDLGDFSSNNAGGLVAYASNGSIDVSDSYSCATVSAQKDRVGSIVACFYKETGTVSRCYGIGYQAIQSTGIATLTVADSYCDTENTVTADMNNGITLLTTNQMTGNDAFFYMEELHPYVWYSIEGKTPRLRTAGIAKGDVDENGEFDVAADSLTLRKTIVASMIKNDESLDVEIKVGFKGDPLAANTDINKSGNIDVCDLVALVYN